MRSATATAPDGCSIHYRLYGTPGASTRFVLVHSLAMTGAFWAKTAVALGPDAEVLALDCRGHGLSGKPAGPYTIKMFAADVLAVMDHAGWQNAVVAGASLGGCVALAVADCAQERVRGLGLIDTTAWYGPNAPADWDARADKAVAEGLASLVPFQQTRWFSDGFRERHPDDVALAIGVFLANDVAAYSETCRMLGRVDLRTALINIIIPVDIVVGEEDYAAPVAMSEAMASVLSRARLTVLPSVRHLTPLEVPEIIADHLKRLGFGPY